MAEIDAEELAEALNLVQSCLYNGNNETDTKALDAVCAAAEAHLAHLRAPKGELEEARAELGAWLAAEDGRVRYTMPVGNLVRVSLYRSGDTDASAKVDYPHRPIHGEGPTEAAAIRAALSRARGEGT